MLSPKTRAPTRPGTAKRRNAKPNAVNRLGICYSGASKVDPSESSLLNTLSRRSASFHRAEQHSARSGVSGGRLSCASAVQQVPWRSPVTISTEWPVESGAGAVTVGYGGCSVAFAPGLSPSPLVPFPDPRSSNRTCGFPASGFRTRSCLRARKGHGLPRETQEAVICAQPLFGVSHESPRPRLMLSTEPLA